jgi:hypothetical protein
VSDPSVSLDQYAADLSNAVYKATEILERLERAGLLRGNGHHLRQKVTEFATTLLRERWVGPQPEPVALPIRPMVLRDATDRRRLELARFDAKNPDLASEHCHAHKDGECFWERCPQTRNGGKDRLSHCPIDRYEEEW